MRFAVIVSFGLAAVTLSMNNTASADPAAGEDAFNANKCSDCHYTRGPAREKTIADQLAKKGPELWYAGSKFQQPWLEQWLQDPQPIRNMKYNSVTEENPGGHPKLAAGDAASVTEFLMSLTSSDVEAGIIKPKRHPMGRLIFVKKMPCSGCHQFPGRKFTGGNSGPSLLHAGTRLNPDWIYAYLKNIDTFKPVRAMPNFSGILSDREMQSVAAYVATFE
ncbi:MAG: Cytochrome c6 [Gammaproteobacteria bacterium]|nr:Cytochrome c6 [Gammaproteobacteria bacterium]